MDESSARSSGSRALFSSSRSRSFSSSSATVIASSSEMRARPSGSGTSVTPGMLSSDGRGLTMMTALSPYLASSVEGNGISWAISGCAIRTTARLRSPSTPVSAAMTSSGSVSVTARAGRPNF